VGFPVSGAIAPAGVALPEVNRLGDAVRVLQDELIASQRLALLGNLSAIAAHEFNNLMTPIIARAEAALTGEPDIPFMRKTLERTLTQAQRAVGLSRHLLELAHDGFVASGTCRLAHVVREAIETATRPFEKDNITLRVDVPEDIWVVGHQDVLVQVVLNLILNARTALKEVGGGLLAISARADSNLVRIAIRDTGKGMNSQWIDTTLNPFLASDPFTAPTDWKQVGLGLSACRMIAYRHGAGIRAEANAERGCTFRLDWPRGERQPGTVGAA
jgi:signal transduction histidine kinase